MKTGLTRGVSHIGAAAAVSVAILIASVGSYIGTAVAKKQPTTLAEREPIQKAEYIETVDADANGIPDWQDELVEGGVVASTSLARATSSEPFDPASSLGTALTRSLIGGYLSLKESDSYTPERGEQLAQTLATHFRAPALFTPHVQSDLTLTPDTSPASITEYRSKMRTAVEPMVDLEAEPEFALFGRFIATGETLWLERLSDAAANYRAVEQNMLTVRVPENAATAHLRALNATGKYAETLERLVRFSNDPLALMALLRTYNESEREMVLAFDSLAQFYVREIGTQ